MAVVINGTTGVSGVDGSAGTPSYQGADSNTGIFFPAADTIAFGEGGAEAMRIDSSGNLGLGVTPSAWSASQSVLQFGTTGRIAFSSIANSISSNAYNNSGWKYVGTGNALLYAQDTGSHIWYNSASGTAGNTITFTQAMTLDASGNLGVGETSIAADTRLHLKSAGDIKLKVETTNNTVASGNAALVLTTGSYGYSIQNLTTTAGSAGVLRFYDNTAAVERARITSGGQFSVNTTATTTTGATHQINVVAASGARGIGVVTPTYDLQCLSLHNQATSNDNRWVYFYTESSATDRGSIDYNRGAGLTRYNTTSDATLKNIIGDSNGQKSLEILNSTRIREYAWKDDAQQNKQIGVIAQELHETYKGAVSVGGEYEVEIPAVTEQRLVSEAVLDEEGNEVEAAVYETVEVEPSRKETKYRPWAVDKTAFTFHLIAGWQAHEKLLKEAMTRIEALEAEVAALKGAN